MALFSKKSKTTPETTNLNKSVDDYQWLALDVGTENFKAKYMNTGLTFNAPTYVAYNFETNQVIIGEEAKALTDKTNKNIIIKRPVRDGNITDPEALERILKKIFQDFRLNITDKTKEKKLIVIMATPSEINQVQRDALNKIVEILGAYRGFVEEEVKMAALGAGKEISGSAIMCIDIGGGSTDIAVINNDSILYSLTTHCAGDFLTEKIQEFIKKNHSIKIGIKEAEDIKKNISSLEKYNDERSMEISGLKMPSKDSKPGETTSITASSTIKAEEVRDIMIENFTEHIIPAIRQVLRRAGELAPGSISELRKSGHGIVICGGGAYIKKIDSFIKKELAKEYEVETTDDSTSNKKPIRQKYKGDEFEVTVADKPLENVIEGCVKYRDTIFLKLQNEADPNREVIKKEEN